MRKMESLQKLRAGTTTYFRTPIVLWVGSTHVDPNDPTRNPLTPHRVWESRPTAEFLKRKKSAQLWCVRTAVCETALQQRSLFKPPHITHPNPKVFQGLEITTIQLLALLTLPHLSHRWLRWVGLKLLCFVLQLPAAMLFRPGSHNVVVARLEPPGWAWQALVIEERNQENGKEKQFYKDIISSLNSLQENKLASSKMRKLKS